MIWVFTSQSTSIMSWSDMTGMVVILFASPGLLVQNRSSSLCSCVSPCSSRLF